MSYRVHVSQISPQIQSEHIRDLFTCCGPIENLEWQPGDDQNRCILSFGDPKYVKAARHLTGTTLGDMAIHVEELDPPAGSAPPGSEGPPGVLPQNGAGGAAFAPPGMMNHDAAAANAMAANAAAIAQLNAAAIAQLPAVGTAGMTQQRLEELVLVSRTVYVGNLAPHVGEQHLRAFFSKYGNVLYVKMAGNPLQAVRYAFLEFDSQETAAKVMALTGPDIVLGDRQLKIGPAMNPIVKPTVAVSRSDPARIEEIMRKVRAAQERIARRKGVSSAMPGQRGDRRSGSRGRRDRSRSRERRGGRRRRRSPSPRQRGPGGRPRSPERPRRRGRPNPHEGMVWDGFQWNPPAEAALKQSQRQANAMSSQQPDAATIAMVQQAAQQAQMLKAAREG